MPTVAHTRQSFTVDGRRVWIVAASLSYARIDPAEWPARLADVRQAGCNAVEVPVPWLLHEPRPGRFDFEGPADLPTFLAEARSAGLHVILRIGPYVGEGFDGGGLPGWLVEVEPPPATGRSRSNAPPPGPVVARTASEAFLDRVAQWFKVLFEHVAPMQVSQGGPILLMQVEHRWRCEHEEEAAAYLGELVRMARESGVDVPLLNANDLWTDDFGTIDTWQGSTNLIANLRQLREIRDDVPRIVSRYEVAARPAAEAPRPAPMDPDAALHGLASILAAGAQPVIAPFHGGVHLAALGGREPGPDGGTPTPAAALGPPIGEAGDRGPLFHRLRRLAGFASSFGHVFADLDPEFQSTVQMPPEPGSGSGRGTARVVAVPLRGSAGRVLFVFADRPGASTTLLLDSGLSLPVELGDQCVGWFAIDVDLGGRARLDFSSCCPAMFVDRRILVFAGAKGSQVIVSIGGTPMESIVPSGRTARPEVTEHQGITVVVVSQEQLDETYASGDAVYVGVSGLDPDGRPRASVRGSTAWVVRTDPESDDFTLTRVRADELGPPIPAIGPDGTAIAAGGGRRTKKKTRKSTAAPATATGGDEPRLPSGTGDWEAAPARPRIDGDSPRYARIKGPSTLAACGARSGYGWYRVAWRSGAQKKRTVLPLGAGNRVRFWIGGEPAATWGVGPDAVREPFDLKVTRGEQVLTALVETLGRPASGNDLDRAPGLHGHLVEVKRVAARKGKPVDVKAIDPFVVRGFLEGIGRGGVSSRRFEWTVSHARKSPLVIHVADAPTPGIILVNDHPVGIHAGMTGLGWTTLAVDPAAEWFKRGRNVVHFAPLELAPMAEGAPEGEPGVDVPGDGSDVAAALAMYEVVDEVTGGNAEWAFERWACPADADFRPVTTSEAKELAGDPCWWRCRFDRPGTIADGAVRVELKGMGLGAVLVNGRDLGRFAISPAGSGARSGTRQSRMMIPRSWLRRSGNVLSVFDETGTAPSSVRITVGGPGDLDS